MEVREGLRAEGEVVRACVAAALQQRVGRGGGCAIKQVGAAQVKVVDGDTRRGEALAGEQLLEFSHERRLAAALGRADADLLAARPCC